MVMVARRSERKVEKDGRSHTDNDFSTGDGSRQLEGGRGGVLAAAYPGRDPEPQPRHPRVSHMEDDRGRDPFLQVCLPQGTRRSQHRLQLGPRCR